MDPLTACLNTRQGVGQKGAIPAAAARKSMKSHRMVPILSAGVAALAVLLLGANWPVPRLAAGMVADRVVVRKARHRLELYARGKLLKDYVVSLGRHPEGRKEREGDQGTPEGWYAVEAHKPDSSFHRALKISYPSAADRLAAEKRGVSPGGDIMIHGIRNGLAPLGRMQRWVDWTAGCVAVTNPEIEEIYRAVPDGTPVEFVP